MAHTENQLAMLKVDLGLMELTEKQQTYLGQLLDAAQKRLTKQGITLVDGEPDHDALVVMYASWNYRKRTGEGSTEMPQPLRTARNDLLFSQKGRTE